MSIADVDGDGCDEIIWGSAALDNNGYMLYATGYGHGDAIHLGKFIPDRKGLQVFEVHEEKPYGWDLHDAATGQIIYSATSSGDNGRGMAGTFIQNTRGGQFSSFGDRSLRSAVTGKIISNSWTSCNFRIYWDGSLYDQWFDKDISKWNGNGTTVIFQPSKYNNSQTCNSTKATPCLQADLFGDWREEIVMYSGNDNSTLNIFTTTEPTEYRIPTLMHDHTYRMGIAWQQAGYNQPPHLGYYLPDYATYFNADRNIKIQDDNGTIKWAFDKGTDGQQATIADNLKKYVTTDVQMAYGLTYGGIKELNGLNETRIGVTVDNDPTPDDGNKLSFIVSPVNGYALNITRIEFTATRIGTDGGNIDVSWAGNKIASGLRPARNKANPEYTTYTYNVTTANQEKGHKLTFNFYNLGITKQFGIANIKLYGTIKAIGTRAKELNVTNGIEDVGITIDDNMPWYTINGVKVEKPEHPGIYIHNKKKVVIK